MEKNQMSSRLMNHVRALQEEISVLKDRIQPHDTGHIHTAISVLTERATEVADNLKKKTQENVTDWIV